MFWHSGSLYQAQLCFAQHYSAGQVYWMNKYVGTGPRIKPKEEYPHLMDAAATELTWWVVARGLRPGVYRGL